MWAERNVARLFASSEAREERRRDLCSGEERTPLILTSEILRMGIVRIESW